MIQTMIKQKKSILSDNKQSKNIIMRFVVKFSNHHHNKKSITTIYVQLIISTLTFYSLWMSIQSTDPRRRMWNTKETSNIQIIQSQCVEDYMSTHQYTSLSRTNGYPQYNTLSDIFEGPALIQPHNDSAICEFRHLQYWYHFPHTMQQLYRCYSYWIAYPQKQPILVFIQSKTMKEHPFVSGFIKVLVDSIGLKVVQRHDGPVVQSKYTNKWNGDIEITDYAILDPKRQLRKLFMKQIPSVVDPPIQQQCFRRNNINNQYTKRTPRIAILNRKLESGRHMLNANEIAASIVATYPQIKKVPIVTFEDEKTFLEQTQFFMETDILLSPHGAQLTGIAFMPPCSSVMEFFPRNYLVADYFGSLAAAVGIDHSYFYLADNIKTIPRKQQYHYFVDGDYRNYTQCPRIEKVMAAVDDLITKWDPCCDIKTNMEEGSIVAMPSNAIQQSSDVQYQHRQHKNIVVDIISSGSIRRPKLHATQSTTIATHPLVRNFFTINELNDTDATCYSTLTKTQIQEVKDVCHNNVDSSQSESKILRTILYQPRNHIGWFCAQKRPIDGLYIALQRYQAKMESIPDYLFLIDDDTYINIDSLLQTLQTSYPESKPHVVTGCGYEWSNFQQHFTYPVYGFGSILTRSSIENLLTPIYCNNTETFHNPSMLSICNRLEQNIVGEKQFFQDGMHIAELMYQFATAHPYTNVKNWTTAYCFHREHFLAYFFNNYFIGVSTYDNDNDDDDNSAEIKENISFKPSYSKLNGKDECINVYGKCDDDARICHKVTPEQLAMKHRRNVLNGLVFRAMPAADLSKTKSISFNMTIDIISTGSLSRMDLLDSQKRTFGSHHLVRNFYPLTEKNDTETNCYTSLTEKQRRLVTKYCKDTTSNVSQSREERWFHRDLFGPTDNSTGWLCAQKRPIDGLHSILQMYKSTAKSIPDYLIMIDDDTYLNIDALATTFHESYPPHETHLIAGCSYMRPRKLRFIFPVGGLGSIYTRTTVQRMIKPIYCKGNQNDMFQHSDPFTRWACWRLEQNHIGEKTFFTDGMSIGDLMYEYASQHLYTKIEDWNQTGYCFHSDHTLAYFFTFYHLSVPDGKLRRMINQQQQPNRDFRRYYSFQYLIGGTELSVRGTGGECKNLRENCGIDSRVCHYMTSEQMEHLYNAQQQHSQ